VKSKIFALVMVGLGFCFGLVSTQLQAAEDYEFLDSENLVRTKRKSYDQLKKFYQDFYIPTDSRKMNPGTPPYVPHRIDKDFRSCRDCHEPASYKEFFYLGIRIPSIPTWVETVPKVKHPVAEGSCRICHVQQGGSKSFAHFYLKEVYPKRYRPKL